LEKVGKVACGEREGVAGKDYQLDDLWALGIVTISTASPEAVAVKAVSFKGTRY